jgi:putative nucleotidyltransferase with HDIG domain
LTVVLKGGSIVFFPKKEKRSKNKAFNKYFKNISFQRLLIGIVILLISFIIIENGAAPRRYKLELGKESPYDITAPRDIENKVKTENEAAAAAEAVKPVMIKLDDVPIQVLNTVLDFFDMVETERKDVQKRLNSISMDNRTENLPPGIEDIITDGVGRLQSNMGRTGIDLTEEQLRYMIIKATDDELLQFKNITRELISSLMNEDINNENLANKIDKLQNNYHNADITQDFKNIGILLAKAVVKPNSTIDTTLTELKRKEAYEKALESKNIIPENSRILSVGDIVTEDKLQMLSELNLLETGNFDYVFASGVLGILILLSVVLILYMRFFASKIFNSRGDLILLGFIIVLTLLMSRVAIVYSVLLIPIFIVPMLISILLDLKLAVVVNIVLTVAISLITKGDLRFIFMAVICGTISAFVAARANQRSKLSAAGLLIAFINVLIIICMGIINKSTLITIANDCFVVSINGIGSMVLTIGLLPFFESTFNIITPLKLLELTNPNQPLIKRLLVEAPGTYHHSLMVGNLAEVATESIRGNALLARVGAFYHDVGKLERPNFFGENQMADNPHDKMTPSLSTLVITSHTSDGVQIAKRYKIPMMIRDIISQHHGTTLVAYFYHKAKKGEKGDAIDQNDFRYEGPKPSSKEAAVVMLADSVEAAVRSMADKTEGKIEGLVRKIIKDKLDDGQLDLCDLTLKDLDDIAKSFMKVFSGYFHQREQYPNVKIKSVEQEMKRDIDPLEKAIGQK